MLKYIIFYFAVTFTVYSQNGIRKTYYTKTQIESKVSFVNGVKDGNAKWYYENGNLREEKNYSNGKLNGWYREFFHNGLLKNEQYIRNGVIDGISNKYYDNGELKSVSIYSEGILEKITRFSYDSNYVAPRSAYIGKNTKSKNYFLCNSEVCAEPVNDLSTITKAIEDSISAKLNNIKLSVLVTVDVNKYGKVTSVKTQKELQPVVAASIEKVIKKNKFIPAEQNGRNIKSQVSFRIKINIKK